MDPDRVLAGRLGQSWQPVVFVIERGEVVGVLAGPGDGVAWTRLARRSGVW
jgi:hypothetical protein